MIHSGYCAHPPPLQPDTVPTTRPGYCAHQWSTPVSSPLHPDTVHIICIWSSPLHPAYFCVHHPGPPVKFFMVHAGTSYYKSGPTSPNESLQVWCHTNHDSTPMVPLNPGTSYYTPVSPRTTSGPPRAPTTPVVHPGVPNSIAYAVPIFCTQMPPVYIVPIATIGTINISTGIL